MALVLGKVRPAHGSGDLVWVKVREKEAGKNIL